LWGLAAGGQAGVEGVLELLTEGLSRTMALAGVRTIAEIDRGMVAVGVGQ
jgi:isopentenyl diphosphate isomerase/L-lactate dehydrogenase-like FMN-dependent dehydrogenase